LFESPREKLTLGAERERGLREEERRLVAYHEAGHALMAWLLPQADPLEKVTIIPHGRALGVTEQLPEEERYNLRRTYLLDRIGVMPGGRIAEQVIFEEVSSGAESDGAISTIGGSNAPGLSPVNAGAGVGRASRVLGIAIAPTRETRHARLAPQARSRLAAQRPGSDHSNPRRFAG